MRLALCIMKYFPFGGLQRNFFDILQVLLDRGHHVTIFTTHWNGHVPQGVHLICIPACAVTNHGKVRRFAETVRPLLRQGRFDVVVGFNKIPGLDVYYAGDPCYEALAQRRHKERLGPLKWLRWLNPRYHCYRLLEQAVFASKSHTRILFLSTAQQDDFRAYYGTALGRSHLLPPNMLSDRQPVADPLHTRRRFRQEFGVGDDELVLLMTGSCLKTKGLDRSMHALSSLPIATRSRCRLMTVGDERGRSFLPLARKLGIQDRIQIFGPRNDIPRFMTGADLLLHPAYSDNTGTVLLESMAYALPCVVTGVCGYARYVAEARAGTVLPDPFAQRGLDRVLLDMLSSPQREQWGRNGAEFVRTLDLSSRSREAATIIESVGRERLYAHPLA